ncbi:hypothetical protein LJK88_24670 [Paenibacillus sp. P26]|nr:hypothetical protein LJK88_24670 [Paenibacillus sp. P26]
MNVASRQVNIVFNKLYVNVIETNSGIFIGVNNAVGWSSHSKSNYGLGSASNCHISGNVSVVQDQDFIDAPIIDRKQIISGTPPEGLSNSHIDFESVNANAITTNSSISVGENDQTGWTAHRKTNYGNGKHYGLNVLKQTYQYD